MSEKLEKLSWRLEKLHAYNECVNLMGKFHTYISQGKMTELIGLWADRDDSLYAAVWGCYEGIRGIKRCFMVDYGDERDPRSEQAYKGYFNYQGNNGEYIEIADDLKTARGTWHTEGCVTFGKECRDEKYSNSGYWNYSSNGVDFICENGVWKLWHMRVASLIWGEYKVPWGDCEPYTRYPVRETTEDKPPMAPIFNYSYDCNYAASGNIFGKPAPYATWDDVAPGYGYQL